MISPKLLLPAVLSLVSCKGLTPTEVAVLSAIDGPLCDIAGFGVSLLVSSAGTTVAALCKDEADKLIQENQLANVPTAPVVPGTKAVINGTTLKVSSTCVMQPIPNDPRKQWACPELHPQIVRHNVALAALKAKGTSK